jgi:hypothetical protein
MDHRQRVESQVARLAELLLLTLIAFSGSGLRVARRLPRTDRVVPSAMRIKSTLPQPRVTKLADPS